MHTKQEKIPNVKTCEGTSRTTLGHKFHYSRRKALNLTDKKPRRKEGTESGGFDNGLCCPL